MPDGAEWYCMSEVGDEVRVVFPDNCEEHAYVASSVHIGSAGGRTNPDEKFWRNRHNKEIRSQPSLFSSSSSCIYTHVVSIYVSHLISATKITLCNHSVLKVILPYLSFIDRTIFKKTVF